MNSLLSISNETEIIDFLVSSLETIGFEIVSVEDDVIRIQLIHKESSISIEATSSSASRSIFPPVARLRDVFEFIESNYHRPIKLKEVAQAVGYSSSYLTNLVRRITGKTVNDWIIERRLSEAKSLLIKTEDSVEQIALKIGYRNLNHFYCQFRDRYQATPRAWREAHPLRKCSGGSMS